MCARSKVALEVEGALCQPSSSCPAQELGKGTHKSARYIEPCSLLASTEGRHRGIASCPSAPPAVHPWVGHGVAQHGI